MTTPPDLRRLREGDEFGAALTKASQHELSSARLQESGRRIIEATAAPSAPSAPPRGLARRAIAAVVSTAGVIGIVVALRSLGSTPEPPPDRRSAFPPDAASPSVIAAPIDAAPSVDPASSAVELPGPPRTPPAAPTPRAAGTTSQPHLHAEVATVGRGAPPTSEPHLHAEVLPPGRGAPPASEPHLHAEALPPGRGSPPASDLAEQLRLYDTATASARAGDYAHALRTLDELERRFPRTTLAAEVALSRAEYLARSGAVDAAIAATEKLVADPRHAGRRAQLLRVLGDLWIRHGDCAKATHAFRDALSLSLPANEAAAVQTGIERCLPAESPRSGTGSGE
jgi:hypothetical protein